MDSQSRIRVVILGTGNGGPAFLNPFFQMLHILLIVPCQYQATPLPDKIYVIPNIKADA